MIWSALVLGFMGSLHCLAMCGPLVLTLNAQRIPSSFDKLLYNGGRIFTYCLLGLLAGVFGSGIEWAAGQQFLSIITGILLMLGLVIGWFGAGSGSSLLTRVFARIKIKLSKMLEGKSINMWWFGVYNGLLPCGLTYVALAASAATGSMVEAIFYMALFGIGTGPMMWMIVSGFQQFNIKWKQGNRVVTGFTWLLAILLIVRGLGLGVPYLSPNYEHSHHGHETHMSTDK